MKKSDIKHGTEYAIGSNWDFDHWGAQRARAVEEAAVQGRRTYYGRASSVTGTRVEVLNDDGTVKSTRVVRNQEIREEWGPYAARRAEDKAARRKALQSAAEGRRSRATKLPQLLALADATHAFPDERTTIYDRDTVALLEEFLTTRIESKDERGWTEVRGPFARSWEDYIRHGKKIQVEADVLFEALR